MKDVSLSTTTAIRGAKVILGDDIVETDILIAGDTIEAIGDAPPADHEIDGHGMFAGPALVDVHGDAFERQVMPRPNVFFPMDAAVLETDRQLASNGIATAYHAVTLGWEPGLRDVARGRTFIEALSRLSGRLTVENRVQLRWETFGFEAIDLIEDTLRGPVTPSLAFNDHLSMMVRDFDMPVQARPFEQRADYPVADLDDPRMRERTASQAKRSGLSGDAYMALMRDVWARRPEVDGKIRHLSALAREVGAPMLSHDDTQVETRTYYRGIGATISEFPMVLPVAEAARAAGDLIIFGSPNAVRGGSHIGSLGAGDMVEAGLCDILASDYYYPAMLAAVARLDHEKRAPRPKLWSLVSTGPARASGLTDRGEIAVGQRADIVLVDWPEGQTPAVVQTLVAGRTAYMAERRA